MTDVPGETPAAQGKSAARSPLAAAPAAKVHAPSGGLDVDARPPLHSRVRVYWKREKCTFDGKVTEVVQELERKGVLSYKYKVAYDDGDTIWHETGYTLAKVMPTKGKGTKVEPAAAATSEADEHGDIYSTVKQRASRS